MTKKFDDILTRMEKLDPEVMNDIGLIAKMGKTAIEHKSDVRDDAMEIVVSFAIETMKQRYGTPNPAFPNHMIVMPTEQNIRDLIYTMLITGIGIAINEEIR